MLIGELHDNPEHHRHQAAILQGLIERGRLHAVVMEHLDQDQANAFNQTEAISKDELALQLAWSKSNWPDFDIFYPIFQVLKANDITVLSGLVTRNELMALYKGELPLLINSDSKVLTILNQALPRQAEDSLLNTIENSHCGMINRDHAKAMLPLQRYRDAYMANRYFELARSSGVVAYILGNGHARRDYGVPYYLSAINSELKIVSVGQKEAGSEMATAAFDFIIDTDRFQRPNPCEKAKHQFKRINKEKFETN